MVKNSEGQRYFSGEKLTPKAIGSRCDSPRTHPEEATPSLWSMDRIWPRSSDVPARFGRICHALQVRNIEMWRLGLYFPRRAEYFRRHDMFVLRLDRRRATGTRYEAATKLKDTP